MNQSIKKYSIFLLLGLSLIFSACSLVEKTPNEDFVNSFLEEMQLDPTSAYSDQTSSEFQDSVSLETFLNMVNGSFLAIESYTSYMQTMAIGSLSVEIGTSTSVDYGDFNTDQGPVPVAIYLKSINGDLKIKGLFTVEALLYEELTAQITAESGYTSFTLEGFDYDYTDREISSTAIFINQDGSEDRQDINYVYGGGSAGWSLN